MVRPSVLLLLCGSLLLPMTAVARLPGPLQAVPAAKVRDLSEIRSSRVLRVLVNQSRNSSGEVQGQAIGVEYHRLRAFEQYLNGHARDGQEINLKIIPKAKDQLLGALQRGEGDLVAPGELLNVRTGHDVSASTAIRREVPLVLVSKQGNRHYRSLEQLAGRSQHAADRGEDHQRHHPRLGQREEITPFRWQRCGGLRCGRSHTLGFHRQGARPLKSRAPCLCSCPVSAAQLSPAPPPGRDQAVTGR